MPRRDRIDVNMPSAPGPWLRPPLAAPLLALAACVSRASRPAPGPPAPNVVEQPAHPGFSALEDDIRSRIAVEAGAEVSVALVDMGTGLRLGVDAAEVMHAASTMKVPVMLEVFRQAEAGRLGLDDPVRITNEFRSIVGDSIYVLPPESDSDTTLYSRIGSAVPVRELVRLMIVRSSNLALNLLIDRVGADRVRATMAQIGAEEMVVRRGVEDLAAFRAGLNNTTTAHGFARVLEAIARCSVTQRSACDEMTDILAAQEFNEMIPAGLPEGTRVAHKTGWITGIQHDGAIVFPPGRSPYVLVVLTRGVADTVRAAAVASDISRLVWDQLTGPSFVARPRVTDAGTLSLLGLHAAYRVGSLSQRHFGHARFWRAVDPFVGGAIEVEQVGESGEGRSIRLLRYGGGPTRVLLWSQMHGDESTATMALADLLHFLHSAPESDRARLWSERLTVLMMPMINPDGAERFQRQDLFGVDVNRDARTLATPEARALKQVRDRWQPEFGFNLHDQNPRTRVGSSERLAAISLLAPAVDAEATETPGFVRARHVAATVRRAIDPLVGGYVTRYDDTFNARAFGDLMQQWGTSTVLIESGGWRLDAEKQYLRAVNFVALVSALDAIATNSFQSTPAELYENLPSNGRAVNDVLLRGGTVVLGEAATARVDIAANFEGGSGGPLRARITEVGDLAEAVARDTIDLTGLFLHPAAVDPAAAARSLLPGMDVSFVVRTAPSTDSEIALRIESGILRSHGHPRRW